MTEYERCKATVYPPELRGMIPKNCSRRATKDGYCYQHHPDAVAKRKAEAGKRADEKWETSPMNLLHKLHRKRQRELKSIDERVERIRKLLRLGKEVSARIELEHLSSIIKQARGCHE